MLTLELSEEETLRPAQLVAGQSYRIILQSVRQRTRLLRELSAWPAAAVVAQDGGLISNLDGWANLALPLRYHAVKVIGGLQGRVAELFAGCGLADWNEVEKLLGKYPDQLSIFERRILGFVRAMLIEPELMIYDSIYDELGPDEVTKVRRFDRLYHLYFPFRTSMLLSFGLDDDHERPLLHAESEPAREAC